MIAMKRFSISLMMGLVFLGLASCSDNKGTPQPVEVKSVTIDASDYSKFAYFSFETGKVVEISDAEAKSSGAWDIAFRGHYPRTNSGKSGNGKGGVIKTNKLSFDEVESIPAGGKWTVDEEMKVPKADASGRPIMPPVYETITGNVLLKSWLKSSGRPPHKYDNSIFLVKGANGKIAKVQLLSLEKKGSDGKPVNGYVTLKYEYPFQPGK